MKQLRILRNSFVCRRVLWSAVISTCVGAVACNPSTGGTIVEPGAPGARNAPNAPEGNVQGATNVSADPSANKIVLSAKDGDLVAVDPSSGQAVRVFHFDDYVDVRSIDVAGSVAYVGAEDNSVNAIDLSSKKLLWDLPLDRYESSELSRPVIVADGSEGFAVGTTGVLEAVALANGRVHWTYPLAPNGDTTGSYLGWRKPTVTSDRIYVGADDVVYAIDRATGRRVWRASLPDKVSGTVKLAGDTVLVSAKTLYALDAATGAKKWTMSVPQYDIGTGSPSVGEGVALVLGAEAAAKGMLYCVDLATGAVRWSVAAGNDYAGVYAPLVVGDYVFAVAERSTTLTVTGNARPFVVEISTGKLVWRNDDVAVRTSPVYANGRLFFGGQDLSLPPSRFDESRGLVTLDASTGKVVSIVSSFGSGGIATPVVMAENGVFRSAD